MSFATSGIGSSPADIYPDKGTLRTSGKAEAPVMGIYTLTVMGLLFILVRENPFVMLPEAPVEGQGLNPLLQDDWMCAGRGLGQAQHQRRDQRSVRSLGCGHGDQIQPRRSAL